LTGWIERAIESLGYLGVALLMFLENLFPPIPSELVMPLAGFTASRGEMAVWATIAVGALGSLAGTSIYYLLGRSLHEETLKRWIRSHGKWLALRESDLESAEAWFDRHGRWALLVCRFIPGIRTVVSLPAGLCGTRPSTFFGYSAAGVLIWTAALTLGGAALGENYERIGHYVGPLSLAVVAALIVVFAIFAYRRIHSR
jgi:membrane protein DedA with SNARE-associated domain